MKNFVKITLASLVFAVSSNVMADDDIDITANSNYVYQYQTGSNNYQDLKLAVISADAVEEMHGDITITASNNSLTQSQYGTNNSQTMSVATVGCNCH